MELERAGRRVTDGDRHPLHRDADLGLQPPAPRSIRPSPTTWSPADMSTPRPSPAPPPSGTRDPLGPRLPVRRPARPRRRAVPVEPDDQRLSNSTTPPRRRPAAELEGVVLRRDRPRQLHHRRQAAAVAVADGPVGTRVRLLAFSVLLPEALCTIAAVGLLFATVRRAFGRRRGPVAAARGADAGHDRDRARQQPRRAARAAARRVRATSPSGRSSPAAASTSRGPARWSAWPS